MIDWFSSLGTNWLLPEFMPADRTTRDVPPTFGANTGHMIYLISQGIIHHARMATSALGRQRDVDTIAKLYQEDEWLSALAAKDEKAVWQKRWFPHNYEVTAFEAYLDMWSMTGNETYKAAVDGAWEMFRASFLHVGGSMALNEGSNGTNLSSGLWYPPKSYYLEGVAGSGFQNHTGRHKVKPFKAGSRGIIDARGRSAGHTYTHAVYHVRRVVEGWWREERAGKPPSKP
jgi:hypothetical protein